MNIEMFNESIGYEICFIRNSLINLNRERYFIKRSGIVFINHKYKTHILNLSNSLTSNLVHSYIKENLIPLIFTSSFKILDMFFEYIIKSNRANCPWRFKEKISLLDNKLDSYQISNNIERIELNAIYLLYKNLVKFRNKLIHGFWGEIENDKMIFKIDTNRCAIEFEQVFALSNISLLLYRIINSENDSNLIKAYISTLHRELNILANLIENNFSKFEEEFILFYPIDYYIENSDEEIYLNTIIEHIEDDLKWQREMMKDEKLGYMFEIIVNNGTTKWCIPSYAINSDADVIKLVDFSDYIIKNEV